MSLALRVSGLQVTTPPGRVLLDVARLEVEAGAAVAIIGPSGAGKSTLLNAVSGLSPVQAGQIVWGDHVVTTASHRANVQFRRDSMGLIFQDHHLIDELDAKGNAALSALFAPKAERAALRTEAEAELRALGLDLAGRKNVTTYSGGERQRIAVARAFVGCPAILIADEPTASLGRQDADRLAKDLLERSRTAGTTLLVATHDMALADKMDRVLTLEDGKLVDG